MSLPKTFFDHENKEAYEAIFSNVVIVDAHTHIGADRDGHGINEKRFIRDMWRCGVNKAIVFPLNEPRQTNFSKANDRILRFYGQYPDKIIPFFRINPKTDWKKEFGKRILQGFRGIKLHPRSQHFEIASREAMKIYEKAEKLRLPIMMHTGFGLGNIANDIEKIANAFPKLKLILGHSAFVDFENTIEKVRGNNNILFDTSTLRIFELMQLLNSVDYSKIVFGSDVPYYDFDLALEMVVDTAIISNKNPNHIKAILGGNISRWFE